MELFKARGLELWRDGARLLGPFDLTLRPGMRVALTGPAGAGQSELLSVLAGLTQPESGFLQTAPGATVALARQPDRAAARLTVAEYAVKALAPLHDIEQQLRRLEQRLDSAEALARYGELAESFEAGGGYRAEAELREMLAVFGLPAGRSGQILDSLSGGELRRLELARTLAVTPDLLLLDDPTAGLDPDMQDLLARRLTRIRGAVVFSSHDRHFVNRAATHTAGIRDGVLTLRRGGFASRSLARTAANGTARRQLLATEGLKLLLGSGSLLSSGPLTVAAGERIVLLGPNGSGKSGLLSHIGHDLHSGTGSAGISWQERVRLRYADQRHAGLNPELSPLENLGRLMSAQRARQLLGLVGFDVRRAGSPVMELERSSVARAGLAAILADESDLLLLDEPENGLDLPGIVLLEDALEGHAGAVILVTHDRQLATGFATRVWSIEDGVLRDYRGGMDGYLSGRLRLEDGLEAAPPQEAPAAAEPETLLQLEEQLAETDERLLDTLGMPERQLERLKRRQRELVSRLMERYDTSYPQPAPRYRVREEGVLLQADSGADGSNLEFIRLAGVRPALRLKAGVAHLQLEVPVDRCLLPWAERVLLNAATRLAFYVLDVRLVQYWSQAAPDGLLLEEAGSGWHALARSRFEQLEGWRRAARKRSRRARRKRQS